MTYEVELVARAASEMALDVFLASMQADGWEPATDGSRLQYRNPDTGVSASIDEATPASRLGLYATGVVFRLNYGRPTWFALETIPVFARATARAGSLVMDPQTKDEKPVEPDADALIESWSRGNQAAIAAAAVAGQRPRTMSASASMAWWRHQRALPILRETFASDHYVPSIHLLATSDDRSVRRAMSWPDVVPALIPECDMFLMLRSSGSAGFGLVGVAEYEVVRSRIDDLLTLASIELSYGTYTISVLPPDRAAVAADRLSSIALNPVIDGLQALSTDDFVDARDA